MWPKLYAKADGNASLVFPGRRRGARARRGLGRAAATACRAPQEIVAGGRRGALVRLLGRARGLTLRIGNDRIGGTLSITNLADAKGNRFALGTPFAVVRAQETPLRPRTIRIGVDFAF